MKRYWDVAVLAVAAIVCAILFQGIQDFEAYMWSWLDTCICAGILSVFLLPLVFWRFKRVKLGLYVAFLLSGCGAEIGPTTSRAFFLRRLDLIKPGMTVSQVDAIMKPVMIERFSSMDKHGQSGVISYRHSNEGMYNADIGEAKFRNGKVIEWNSCQIRPRASTAEHAGL